MQLQWHKRDDGSWHALHEIDVARIEGYGVFIIWRDGNPRHAPAVLYVGRGRLKHEIDLRRQDPLFHGTRGLYATWALVATPRDIEPVAAYLYQQLRPLWGEIIAPSPQPVPVNLPQTG